MTPRGRAGWLPSALLLLQLPGCLSLSGPRRVTGIVGRSLSVQCQYQEEFINNTKYWCKPPCVLSWRMVETTESEREVRRGHVSIRDHPASLTFTVTLENLREEDAGTYWCGIDVLSTFDPIFEVEVSVIPAPATASGPERPTGSPGSPMILPVPTWSTASAQETPDPGQAPRPLRSSADRRRQSIYENQ
ncbi:CMRF35-like molecule 6 isoform X2 [Bos indicus]|uniref:CMRF35-like molecule 6 isoform X2 n=1 Tax=Bos indicus TaxID=9915 RepID=A0A6P5DJY5_BOSIN